MTDLMMKKKESDTVSAFLKNKQIFWSFFGTGKNFNCQKPTRSFDFLSDDAQDLNSITCGMKYDILVPGFYQFDFLLDEIENLIFFFCHSSQR